MSKIPLSRDFRITPAVVNAAGTAIDASGLVLSENELVPVGVVSVFSSAENVRQAYGSESDEYAAAQLYFSGYDNSSTKPGELLMYRLVRSATEGWLLSGSFKGKKIADLHSIIGTITLSVDGTPITSASIDLSGATSFSDAATTIAAAIGSGVTVEWLPIQSRFIIRSVTTGSSSVVSQATSGATADALLLTVDTGATVSPGSDVVTMLDMMGDVINQNQNWVLFSSLVDLTDDEKEDLCRFASASNNRFGYSLHDPSLSATVPNNTNCFAQKVIAGNGYENIIPVFGDYLQAILPLAYAASLDFGRIGGRVSYKFRNFPGIAPTVSDAATADALESNGYSFYGSYGLNRTIKTYVSDGKITGKFLWLDSFVSEVWINANLVAAFANLFTQNASYSFSAAGYAAVSSVVIDVANAALTFGAIRSGVTLDAAQLQVINASVGFDISNVLFSQGWYLFIPQQSGASRTERKLDNVIFYYVDGQLIQQINLTSTDIL